MNDDHTGGIDLGLVTTEGLLCELGKRFDAAVFCARRATSTSSATNNDQITSWASKLNLIENIGLSRYLVLFFESKASDGTFQEEIDDEDVGGDF